MQNDKNFLSQSTMRLPTLLNLAFLTMGFSLVRAASVLGSSDSQLGTTSTSSTFRHIHYLPQLSERLSNGNLPKWGWGFDTPIADHYICFRFHCESETLLVKPRLSSITSDRIRIQLVGSKKLYKVGLEFLSLTSAAVPLITATVFPLGKMNNIRALMQNNPFIYLIIDVLVAPGVEIRRTSKPSAPTNLVSTEKPEPSEPDSPPIARTHLVHKPKRLTSTSSTSDHLSEPFSGSEVIETREIIWTKEKITEQLRMLMDGGEYDKVIEFCDSRGDREFVEYIYPAMSTLEHYNGLAEYLKRRKAVSGFFVHGNMELVKKVIVAFKDNKHYVNLKHLLCDPLTVALIEDYYDRFIDLLGAVQESFGEMEVNLLVTAFMLAFSPVKNSASFKRFLVSHGEKFSKDHLEAFEGFWLSLIIRLRLEFSDPKSNSKQLLVDLIRIPLPIPPIYFAEGFLGSDNRDNDRTDFIALGWRKAIEEGMNGKFPHGREGLWRKILIKFPEQFFPKYPPSPETRAAVLARFKTKEEIEEPWRQGVLTFIAMLSLDTSIPTVLLEIIFAYSPPLIEITYKTDEQIEQEYNDALIVCTLLPHTLLRIISEYAPLIKGQSDNLVSPIL